LASRRLHFPNSDIPASTDALREEVRRFLAEELASEGFEARCDSWLGGFSPEFSRRLGERGWVGMTLPERYGGSGRTAVERFVVVEELLAAGAPIAAHWIADRQIGPMLVRYGTEAQRQLFLPRIARGELYFAIGMSEPDSGSDLASVRTTARRAGDRWSVSGSKVWTSHAHNCDFMVTLCRTQSLGADRHVGLSQLIVDLHGAGVEIRPIRLITGDEHFCEVTLKAVEVLDEMVVGEIGQGWHQVTSELAFERSGPERFLSTFPLLVELVREIDRKRHLGGALLLGKLLARLSALRRLSLSVAAAIDADELPAVEAALVKEMGTRFERQITEAARELVVAEKAGPAFRARLNEAVLHSPGFTLRGGTNEILRGIIARELAGR
jgi:alkylation response protein AidB-like acyl-CoA dehydrogenase